MPDQVPVTGPYNFVPLSEHIILPEWGDAASQDIPFRDGSDGEFDIVVTAVSPIYVRNGQSTRDKNNPDTSFFHAPDGRFCIPGTSVKGMTRNVLEISTFSRMRHISDSRYGIRDLKLTAYTSQITEPDYRSKARAGFLDISTDDWKIIPCSWASWRRKDFDPAFGNEKMSAAAKYERFLDKHGTLFFAANVEFVKDGKDKDGHAIIPHNEATFCADGKKQGVMVFTGQPQKCDPGNPKDTGKRREYFFYDPRENEAFAVDDEAYFDEEKGETVRRNQRDFKFIHEEQSRSGDFHAWVKGRLVEVRKNYFRGRIPVFYIEDERKRLRSFGLAAMFRFAGAVSTVEALRNTNADHYPERDVEFPPDMADLIFGYATRKKSLRGRVQFSACFADVGAVPQSEEKVILGNPKPSFYPAYLEQDKDLDDREKYKTWLDKDARLRGWKRYPAMVEQDKHPDTGLKQVSNDIFSRFCPLPAGTEFTGKVRYHNLKEVELGALIWSLRLKNFCHSLGMGKPFGFGKVKVKITGMPDEEQLRLCKVFTDYVEAEFKKDSPDGKCQFEKIPQIKSLLDMAKYGPGLKVNQDFRYMTTGDCSACKGSGSKGKPNWVPASALEPYMVLPGYTPPPPKPKKAALSGNAAVIEQLRGCANSAKNALKLIRSIEKATPDEVAGIRAIFKKVQWANATYGTDKNAFDAEMKRLEQG